MRRVVPVIRKDRVQSTPISESALLGAAVTIAMAGLRPVVEIMLIYFIGVYMDGILPLRICFVMAMISTS